MELQTFLPSDILKPYIKYYWVFSTDQSINDAIYPSGYLELAINISAGTVVSVVNGKFITTNVYGNGDGYVTEEGLWQSFDANNNLMNDGKFLVL